MRPLSSSEQAFWEWWNEKPLSQIEEKETQYFIDVMDRNVSCDPMKPAYDAFVAGSEWAKPTKELPKEMPSLRIYP